MTVSKRSERRKLKADGGPYLKAGPRIRELRSRRGLVLDDLARKTSLSKPYISQIETGKASPSLGAMERIAHALGVPLAYLFLEDRFACHIVRRGARQTVTFGAPDKLDVWRTALFLGAVFESPRTRVIGVDGQAGPMLLSALDTLCDSGWLSAAACSNAVLAYETTNGGAGWYFHHHHHAHISLKNAAFVGADDACLGTCDEASKRLPGRSLTLHRVRAAE